MQAAFKPKIVIVSGVHDYRTPRRASIQALADAYVRLQYDVTFISVRFSPISRIKGDHRNHLRARANRPETVNDVTCYLWWTPFHPFATQSVALDRLSTPLFAAYAHLPDRFIDQALGAASFIIIESGLGIVLTHRARRLNPRAKIIYRASDALDTIGAAPTLQEELRIRANDIDAFCLLTTTMARDFGWATAKTFIIPHGINPDDFTAIGPDPYGPGVHAVTVGSMLFDTAFFEYAASKFPHIQFHLIGTGADFPPRPNVRLYSEMPFKATLPYIKHADFGIAAYRPSKSSEYLPQSSLKLMQYEYLQIPAVCPDFAVGKSPNRFGYSSADRRTIAAAIEQALSRGPLKQRPDIFTWQEVAQRLLFPESYADAAPGGMDHADRRYATGHRSRTTEATPS